MQLKPDFPIGSSSGYACGGSAELFIEVHESADLFSLETVLAPYERSYCVLGACYNTLISDSGIKKPVIRLTGKYLDIEILDDQIRAGAGGMLSKLINCSKENQLGGLEFLSGIPGTIGGAIYGNSGSGQNSILEFISQIKIYDMALNLFQTLKVSELSPSYRNSALPENCIITEAVFDLKPSSKTDIIQKINAVLERKKNTQPIDKKSCGCVFKNPPDTSAAYLIEKAGLKGAMCGGAKVSEMHSNFIINESSATATDVWGLVKLVRERIKAEFNIDLALEINTIGAGFE